MSYESLALYCKGIVGSVNVTEEEADKMERETREQRNSSLWFACRAGRITASHPYAVCLFNKEKPAKTTVKNVCYPGSMTINAPALSWGEEFFLRLLRFQSFGTFP